MPRTEQEILKNFEMLGYKIVENSKQVLKLLLNDFGITIRKYTHKYRASDWSYLDMQEHLLLHELFTCWGWI